MKRRMGRPPSGTAVPVAERVAAYRARVSSKRLEVMLPAGTMKALQALVDATGESRAQLLGRLLMTEVANPSETTRKRKKTHAMQKGKERKRAELLEALSKPR